MRYDFAAHDTALRSLPAESWSPSSHDDPAESRRRRVVKLIFLVYWLLILEGALRKWVLPQFQKEIYFIRDPIVLAVYWMSIRYRLFRHSTIVLTITALIAWLCMVEVVFHAMSDKCDPLLTGYGLRSYFFYIPLALVIAETFDRADLERLIRQTLLFSIPAAAISIFQSLEPAGAIINAGVSSDPENQVHTLGVVAGVVRTTGTFTSNYGQGLFVGSVLAMLVWVWTLPANNRPLRGMALLAVTAAALTNVAVSGQRTIFVLAALVLSAAVVAAVLIHGVGTSWNVIKSTVILAAIGVFLGPVLFPYQLHALGVRSAQVAKSDDWYSYGLVNRALKDFVLFEDSIDSVPLTGYGIGETSNAGEILHRSFTGWIENDWQRHLVELGPVLGLVVILFRIALVVWLCANACIATRRKDDALGLLFFGFIGIVVLYSEITTQGTVSGYGWLFAGFCMAANRSEKVGPNL
jgi:hypothetical protein